MPDNMVNIKELCCFLYYFSISLGRWWMDHVLQLLVCAFALNVYFAIYSMALWLFRPESLLIGVHVL
jgi:hypothetical protein